MTVAERQAARACSNHARAGCPEPTLEDPMTHQPDTARRDGQGEPAELRDLPREVRRLVHAADRMRGDWAESSIERRAELWRDLHEASDAVWNRPPAPDQTALRDRIADALSDARRPGLGGLTEAEAVGRMADAVLAKLSACSDPIECSHEAALGEAQQEAHRLGLMVDEYGAGASALTDKLKRIRDLHRETCILAKGEVRPTAFTCSLCEVLDAPAAAVLPAGVDRADIEAPATECSAQHRQFDDGRLCIRAAQHHGDHIDERGFHWSDTVAVYPLAGGTFRSGIAARHLRRVAAETHNTTGHDSAALARVRQLHDRLAEETDLASPDDEITRGKAAKLIATALDGWNPDGAPQCPVEFENGARCAKAAGHRPLGSDDPHVPAAPPAGGAPQPKENRP